MVDNNSKVISDRTLSLTIFSKGTEEEKIYIDILAEKFKALQESLYGIANAMEGISGRSKGKWKKQLQNACRLVFSDVKKGSLSVMTRVEEPVEAPLDDSFDLGLQAVKTFKQVTKVINEPDNETFKNLLPYAESRNRFLRKYRDLYPDNDKYKVAIGNGIDKKLSILTFDKAGEIEKLFAIDKESTTSQKCRISGEFIEIRIGDDKRHFAIRTSVGEERCPYEEEMENYISQIPAGSLVEIYCSVTFDKENKIKDICEVFDLQLIDLEDPIFDKFIWGDKKYILKESVAGKLLYRNNLWVYELEEYGLYSYSYDRREALIGLHEDFAFQCDDFLGEADENLTQEAREIRDAIKSNLLKIEELN